MWLVFLSIHYVNNGLRRCIKIRCTYNFIAYILKKRRKDLVTQQDADITCIRCNFCSRRLIAIKITLIVIDWLRIQLNIHDVIFQIEETFYFQRSRPSMKFFREQNMSRAPEIRAIGIPRTEMNFVFLQRS